MAPNKPFLLGEVTVEPRTHVIVIEGVRTPVEPLVMRILLRLAEAPEGMLSREKLIASVWPDEMCDDSSLYRAIWGLRRVLGDDSGQPRYVETIPRVGYRLIAEVKPLKSETPGLTVSGNGLPGGDGVAHLHEHSASKQWSNGPAPLAISHSHQPVIRRGSERMVRDLWAAVASLSVVVFGLIIALVLVMSARQVELESVEVYRTSAGADSVVVRNSSFEAGELPPARYSDQAGE